MLWFRYLVVLLFISACSGSSESDLTSEEIIKKSVEFHDPYGNWAKLKARFNYNSVRKNGRVFTRKIQVDNENGYLSYEVMTDSISVMKGMIKDSCFYFVDGQYPVPSQLALWAGKFHLTDCERTGEMRNYLLFLSGLPMKLLDEGTEWDEDFEETEFNEEVVYAVQVDYEKDAWTFYFDKQTFALKGYEFTIRESGKNEFVYMDGITEIDSIRLVKKRDWYLAPHNTFLGSEVIELP
jgi:hypothetical protein